jgi:protoporphyrinogen IX oxidase
MPMYDWVKALHVVAVVSWMAGLLYLPRLMVYHCETKVSSSEDERFRLMEHRLMRAIMDPAGLVVLVSGAWLFWKSGYGWGSGWIVVKIAAVAGLLAIHGLLGRHRSQFARGERGHSARYFRVLNEVPTALMIVIVIMVIVKPFE